MEALFARTTFQAFLFAGAVIIGLFRIYDPSSSVLVIQSVVLIATCAIAAFVIHLIIQAFREQPSSSPENNATQSSSEEPWPDTYQVRVARGFILLGLIIYIGYSALDAFVIIDDQAAERISLIFYIRISVSIVILSFWLMSFFSFFRKHYVSIVTTAITIAGIGVGAMLYVAGPAVHFYYQGFVQVIAFAAFAFRLPPRPLAWECVFLLLLYGVIAFYQSLDDGVLTDDRAQQAVIANNLVSLVTFVVLALVASAALHRRQVR